MHLAATDLLEHVADAVITLDPDERVTYFNGSAREILRGDGDGEGDFHGRRPWEIVPALRGSELHRAFLDAVRNGRGEPRQGELRHAERWFDFRVLPGEGGTTLVLHDQTVSRTSADALSESNARFQAIFDEVGIGIAVVDLEGRTLDTNPEMQRMLGYSAEELRQLNIRDFTHPDDMQQDLDKVVELAEGRVSSYHLEKRYIRRDGSSFWAKLSGTLLPPNGHGVVRGIGLVEDITERRRSEEATQRQAIAFDVLDEGLLILDPTGRIVDWNAGAERMYGYSREEAVGRHPDFLHHPSIRDSLHREIMAALETDGKWDGEFQFVRKDGSAGICHLTTVVYRNARGEISGHIGVNRDVTRRRLEQQALLESEEKFRQIAENVREIFWIFTPDFSRAIYISPTLETASGVRAEDVYADGRAFLHPVHPEDVGAVVDAMDRIRSEEVLEAIEFRMRHTDGTWRWFSARGYPVRDEQGNVYRVVGTSEDITDRKNAEALLKAAEAHYRRLVETSPYTVFAVDGEGRFTELSQAASDVLGRTPGDLIGRPFAEIFAEEHVARATESLRQTISGDLETAELEACLAHASGDNRLVHIRSSVIRDEDGCVTGAHGVVRDITVERERERTMRLLTAALESFDSGVSIADSRLRLLYANASFARLIGVPRETLTSLTIDDLLPDGVKREELVHSAGVSSDRGQWTGRIWKERGEDQKLIPLDVIAGGVEAPTGDRNLFLIINDATDTIERESYLRRVERLASVGTLLGGVAHELNNPLHAIRSFADLMLMDGREGEDLEALQIIGREADRAAKIVSDLRLIARDTQERDDTRQSVDLNEIVRHVLKVRRYPLETASIEIREDLADNLPEILARRGEIEQVLLNLVVNAEQAMQHQEGIRRLIVRTRRSPGSASVHIVDSGPGIESHHLEQIFDPFFTTKDPGEGTGLGLSLVHSIVTEHGGTIYVDSEPGKGTAFRVNFPRAHRGAGTPSEPHPLPTTAGLRILVVDDEEAIRSASARYLTRLGHSVGTAADGNEALRLIAAGEYDLVLSDLKMPGLSGDELYRRLLAQGAGMERRLIFMTGDAAGAGGARLFTDASVPVLLKPVKLEDLARAVEQAARRLEGGAG